MIYSWLQLGYPKRCMKRYTHTYTHRGGSYLPITPEVLLMATFIVTHQDGHPRELRERVKERSWQIRVEEENVDFNHN